MDTGFTPIENDHSSDSEGIATAITSSEVIPGLADLCDLVSQGAKIKELDPISLTIAPQQLLKFNGVPPTVVDADFLDLISPNSQTLQTRDEVGWFETLLQRYLDLYKLRVHQSWIVEEYVECLQLHSPRSKGSIARLTHQLRASKADDFSIALFGIGGGSGKKVTLALSSGLEARDGRCYAVEIPFELKIEKCSYSRKDHVFTNFYRVSAIAAKEGLRQRLIAPGCEMCSLSQADVKGLKQEDSIHSFDLSQTLPSEIAEITLEIESQQSRQAVVDIKPKAIPINAQVLSKIETVNRLRFSYLLPGGVVHFAYRPSDFLSYCWGIKS